MRAILVINGWWKFQEVPADALVRGTFTIGLSPPLTHVVSHQNSEPDNLIITNAVLHRVSDRLGYPVFEWIQSP